MPVRNCSRITRVSPPGAHLHFIVPPCAEAGDKCTADFWRSMENHFLGVPPRRVGAAGALTRSRASTTRTRRPQSVAGPRQMALVNFQVHRGTGCSSSRWLRASLQIVLFARPNSISDAPARSTRAKSSALAPWSFERALQNKRSGRWAHLWPWTAWRCASNPSKRPQPRARAAA